MTVGVAAIALYEPDAEEHQDPRSEQMIIMSADRMITVGARREYQLSSQTKAITITPLVQVLIAGSGEALLEICLRARLKVVDRDMVAVSEIAELLAEEFTRYRTTRNERRVLSQFGLSFDTFHDKQSSLAPDFIRSILNDLSSYKANIGSALVAGVDAAGAHIYRIDDPGVVETCGQAGYAAIGVGAEFAETIFMEVGYTRYQDWTTSLLLTFEAKKRAEVAAGVGDLTDLWWITRPNGIVSFGPRDPLVASLENVFHNRVQRDREALAADHRELLRHFEEINSTPQTKEEESGPGTSPIDEGAIEGGH